MYEVAESGPRFLQQQMDAERQNATGNSRSMTRPIDAATGDHGEKSAARAMIRHFVAGRFPSNT